MGKVVFIILAVCVLGCFSSTEPVPQTPGTKPETLTRGSRVSDPNVHNNQVKQLSVCGAGYCTYGQGCCFNAFCCSMNSVCCSNYTCCPAGSICLANRTCLSYKKRELLEILKQKTEHAH